jgi:RHS repeat-associated protein
VDEQTVKFTGHQRDAHGLSDYMLGRTCLWPLRRFASVDPARTGWNLYAYASNSPIVRIDPDGRVDLRSDEDKAILEDPDVLAANGEIIEGTNLDKSMDQRVEYATIVTNAGESDYGATEVFTSNSQTRVNYSFSSGGSETLEGESVAATIHSHPGSGRLDPRDPTSPFGFGGRSSGSCARGKCTGDKELGQITDRPVYILNANSTLVKYDPSTGKDVTIMTRKDYKRYLERAVTAFKARE